MLDVPGEPPLVFDLGTGLRAFGEELAGTASNRPDVPGGAPAHGSEIAALLTHLHWDHLIGLPFFAPLRHPGTRVEVFGPAQAGGLGCVLEEMLKPPFFPVEVAGFEGEVVLSEVVGGDDFAIGQAKVRARWVPHVGRTLGYRVEQMGCSVAFVSDHQRPEGGVEVDAGVLELCEGADLVVHDAQYSAEEFDSKAAWGHSTVEYAVHVASEAGAKRLALFHHDPGHSDDDVDRLLEQASRLPEAASLAGIFAAYEGLAVDLGSP